MGQQTLQTIITLSGKVDNSFGNIGTALINVGNHIDALSQKIIDFGKESVEEYVEYDDVMREVQALGEYDDKTMRVLNEYTIAPTRVQAFGEIAEYIHRLECTDDEERYLEWEFCFDGNLFLQYIIIPACDSSNRPAKIITGSQVGDSCKSEFRIFGNPDHIITNHPQAMSHEEYSAWLNYKYDHFSRN